MFRLIFLTILGVYIGTNAYIARMLCRWLGLSGMVAACWYVGFTLVAGGYFLSSMAPAGLRKGMALIGGWYMGAYVLLVAAVPLCHLLLRSKNGPLSAGILLVAALVYVLVGIYTASHIRTTSYTVESGRSTPVKIALISDLHAGDIIGAEKIGEMVERINAIDADIVLVAGDLFDVAGPKAVPDLEAVGAALRGIHSKQGVYAVFGNHDAGFDHQDAYAQQLMEDWGMTVLRDEAVELEDVVIVGRRDAHEPRKTVEELMAGIDRSKTVILMDHQPSQLTEGAAAGVDLMVCGHTHGGQVFPANLITGRMFKLDYGILREDGFTAVVSSGAGTWGPRMRVATVSEVVEITLK